MKLYELNEAILNLEAMLDADEVDLDTFNDTLDGLMPVWEELATGLASWVQNMKAEAAAVKEAKARMAKRQSGLEDRVKRVQEYLGRSMKAAGVAELKTDEWRVRTAKSPDSVLVSDDDAVPSDYRVEKTTFSLDKRKLLSDLKAGVKIEGVALVQDKISLRWS